MQNEIPFKTKNQSPNFWASYARQTIDFQHALGELIDNSFSARRVTRGGRIPASIEVVIEQLENMQIKLQIADEGTGVKVENITSDDNIFNLGYTPAERGDMNEHGFGLKNALAMLTSGFQTDFSFLTRPDGEDVFYRVDGPIKEEMSAYKTDQSDWDDGLEYLLGAKSGVKIVVEVKPEYFETIYSRGSQFDTLVMRLGEHLGVMYHVFLKNSDNTIKLRYKSKDAEAWTERYIPSIPPPFLVNQEVRKEENTINIEYAGNEYKATYIQGTLDASVKEPTAEQRLGWPYPLRIHYQGSNARCGVTLIVRDRVLMTGVFKEIWPDKAGDVSFNNFLGELRLDSHFSTTNNKTYLDPHSEIWKRLREKLRTDFEPERTTKKQSEESLRNKVIQAIAAANHLKGKNKPAHKRVWDGGADIDVYYEANNDIYLLETKVESAKVLDVYQLVMYWDGIVEEVGNSPQMGTLVADKFEPYVLKAIKHVNQLKDKNGNSYVLKDQTLDSYE